MILLNVYGNIRVRSLRVLLKNTKYLRWFILKRLQVLKVRLREKQLKNWHRQWKINLIEQKNPEWNDLYNSLL